MIAGRREISGRVFFTVSNLDPSLTKAVRDLGFQEVEGGFARVFSNDFASLNTIYDHFAASVEKMILQASGSLRLDWESSLESFLQRMRTEKMSGWWLTGSTALAVRGIGVLPRDIDFVVASGLEVRKLGEIMSDWLVEPVQKSEGWIARWFGRAFKESRIEWVGEVEDSVDRPEPCDFGPTAASQLQPVEWRGYTIPVPPLDLQLAVSTRRGMVEKAEKIRKAIREENRSLHS